MVLDTSLLSTQQYKERIKGKVEESWERSSALHIRLGVVAIEKGAFRSPSSTVANFTFFFTYNDMAIEFIQIPFAAQLSFLIPRSDNTEKKNIVMSIYNLLILYSTTAIRKHWTAVD